MIDTKSVIYMLYNKEGYEKLEVWRSGEDSLTISITSGSENTATVVLNKEMIDALFALKYDLFGAF